MLKKKIIIMEEEGEIIVVFSERWQSTLFQIFCGSSSRSIFSSSSSNSSSRSKTLTFRSKDRERRKRRWIAEHSRDRYLTPNDM